MFYMENLYRRTGSKKRHVEFICNYVDEEWLDVIGTNGMRVSIPAMLIKSEIFPDDVLSIEVKRDDIKTARRRQGKLSATIDLQVLSYNKKQAESFNEEKTEYNSSQEKLSNIIYLPDSNTEPDPSAVHDNDKTYPGAGKNFNYKDCALRKRRRK